MLEYLATNLEMTVESIELFGLVLVRVGTLVFILPFLGIQNATPTVAKAGLSFFIALLVFPMLKPVSFVIHNSTPFFMVLVLEQVMVGLIIGFTFTFMFHFVKMGGYLISRDIGIMMGGTIDPIQEENTAYFGVLVLLILSMVFLMRGNHHYLLKSIFDSFEMIPLGQFSWEWRPMAQVLTLMSASAILTGVKLAGPIMITLLLTSIGMALIARVMPQMNVWIVSIPIKVTLGCLAMWQVFPLMADFFEMNFHEVQEAIKIVMQAGGVSG
ncbi:MAG: flagellar biosynthetic protein FliR [Fibrobacter sp.]|nr:flagellar biosynthetic protein FliR [Fibrobacter sp.]